MKKLLPFFILILCVRTGSACSCGHYDANFYNSVSIYTINCIAVFDTLDYNYVDGHNTQISYFTLIDTINSNPSSIGSMMVILGQNGFNCGESLFGLAHGDTLILALYDIGHESVTFHLEGLCALHHIRITNGQHDGLTIPEIKNKILEIISAIERIDISESISIYPNPTSDKIIIQSSGEKIISVSVFDFAGRLLLFREEEQQEVIVDVSGLKSGIYNLVLITDKGIVSRAIIRQ